MEIVEVKREAVQPFLDREWRSANEEQFGWYEPGMWEERGHTLAAYGGGEVVGVAVFHSQGGVGRLSQLLVAASHRSKGVGGRLLARCEEICRRDGCHKVRLITYADSQAETFYRLHGYGREGFLRRDIQGTDMVVMGKFLVGEEEGG